MVIFTAGLRRFTGKVLDHLDPKGTRLRHRLHRDSCYLARCHVGSGLKCVKPLSALGRDLNRAVLVGFVQAVCIRLHQSAG